MCEKFRGPCRSSDFCPPFPPCFRFWFWPAESRTPPARLLLHGLVIVREGRALPFRRRIGFQLLQQYLHRLFQLRIMPFAPGFGGEFASDIGRNAVVLAIPFFFGVVESHAGRSHSAAVYDRGIIVDADECP